MASIITPVLLVCCVYMVFGANVYKLDDIQKTSQDNRNGHRAVNIVKRSSSVATFENETYGLELQRKGNDVFRKAINRNEGVFVKHVSNNNTFKEIMKQIFIRTENDWESIKAVIVDELLCVNRTASMNVSYSDSLEIFYEIIIKLYTTRILHNELNFVLRNHKEESDSFIGSYALMLNVVLSQWTKLSSYTGTTYRGVKFDIDKYTVNTIFTWTGFTSSSSNRTVACNFTSSFKGNVLFTIDNSAVSDWRPRGIANMSAYLDEYEYLYPATAIFKVTAVMTGRCTNQVRETFTVTAIYLSLQRGVTQDGVNVAAIIGGTAGGVAFLAIVESVVVGVLLT